MKIKTLEDIRMLKTFTKFTIKQEAIKRAKFFKIKIMEAKSSVLEAYYQGKRDEVMEFNNITEDDLK